MRGLIVPVEKRPAWVLPGNTVARQTWKWGPRLRAPMRSAALERHS